MEDDFSMMLYIGFPKKLIQKQIRAIEKDCRELYSIPTLTITLYKVKKDNHLCGCTRIRDRARLSQLSDILLSVTAAYENAKQCYQKKQA